ncbi:MAG: YidC/Oxa1 family insertase periplasmic-domain containing protein [bacterium]|nr:YidC/Oxa1 family insertase periplasmic-domain containing protein [bacterium]
MRKNELIAILLSALVIMLYFGVIYPRYAPPPIPSSSKPLATDTAQIPVSVSPTPSGAAKDVSVFKSMFGTESRVQPLAIDAAVLAQAKDIQVDTELYRATFSTLGGKLTSWRLKKYRTVFDSIDYLQKELATAQEKNGPDRVTQIQQRIAEVTRLDELNKELRVAKEEKDSQRITELHQKLDLLSLVNLIDSENNRILPLELHLAGLGDVDTATLYQVSASRILLNTTVSEAQLVFSTVLPNGTSLQKIYRFNNRNYLMNCQIKLTNPSDKIIPLNEHGEGFRIGLGSGLSRLPLDLRHAMAFELTPMVQRNKTVTQFKLNKKNPRQSVTGDLVWAGMQSNYFLKVLAPQVSVAATVTAELGEHQAPNVWVHIPGFDLRGNDTYSFPFSFYLGPKELEHLELAKLPAEQILFPGFWLAGLDMLVLKTLKFCYRLIPNYGVAIILLSIFFKLLTLPLTQMSFKSMKKMQLLAPQMSELKTKYKEDPRRMHQETMALMKKYRVSYGSGCLPLLIQMPIMFALYTTISRAVELTGAPFIFWIKDLSQPDTLFYIAGLPFNILPILMGVSMIWQMKMTPNPDPQQHKMMMFMNVFFIFLFWGLSSGLVLYWFITNILSIIHQYHINKQPIKLEPVVTGKSKYSRWQELKKKYKR